MVRDILEKRVDMVIKNVSDFTDIKKASDFAAFLPGSESGIASLEIKKMIDADDKKGFAFEVFLPGSEFERVERIVANAGDDFGFKVAVEPFGSYNDKNNRLRYSFFGFKRKGDPVNLRRRLGCRWSGLGKGTYFMVNEDGYDWASPSSALHPAIRSASSMIREFDPAKDAE